MSRKDYIAIAKALHDTRPYAGDDANPFEGSAREQWFNDAAAIADVLQADNPRFDRQRFLTACGWNVG